MQLCNELLLGPDECAVVSGDVKPEQDHLWHWIRHDGHVNDDAEGVVSTPVDDPVDVVVVVQLERTALQAVVL